MHSSQKGVRIPPPLNSFCADTKVRSSLPRTILKYSPTPLTKNWKISDLRSILKRNLPPPFPQTFSPNISLRIVRVGYFQLLTLCSKLKFEFWNAKFTSIITISSRLGDEILKCPLNERKPWTHNLIFGILRNLKQTSTCDILPYEITK